jgi:hypothetical protein
MVFCGYLQTIIQKTSYFPNYKVCMVILWSYKAMILLALSIPQVAPIFLHSLETYIFHYM